MDLQTFNVEYLGASLKITADYRSKDKGLKLWSKWIKQSNALAFYKSSQSLVKWSDGRELRKRFISLKARKIYFYGKRNSAMKVLNELANVEKISISNSGHFLMNDNPREFYHALAQFVGRGAD